MWRTARGIGLACASAPFDELLAVYIEPVLGVALPASRSVGGGVES
jgi:hypothetical protein